MSNVGIPSTTHLCVDDVLITHELQSRPSREPDYAAESRSLGELAQVLAANPNGVLQKLVDLVIELCGANSAGVSILEPGGEHGIFRWHAIAGAFAPYAQGTMPLDASPCGTVITRDQVLLFSDPERFFPNPNNVEPRAYEHLLVPWHVDGEPIGTVWAVAHTPEQHFDAEDARLLVSLSRFAAAAWQTISALQEAEARRRELEQRVEERTATLESANTELRASDERLRRILETETVGILIFDASGAILQSNDAFLQMTGYTQEQVERRELSWQRMTPSEWMAESERQLAKLAATGRIGPYEKPYILADGSLRWMLFAGRDLGDGTVAEYCIDISERKQMEAALRESEERQAFLLKLSDALRPLADPKEIQAVATSVLREQLDAGWCYYVEWNETDRVGEVLQDATREGLPSLAGTHDVSDVSEFLDLLRSGQLLNVLDDASFALLTQHTRERYTALGIRSMLGAPLVKEGRLVALLLLADTSERHWPESAVALLQETAERTWAAVERVRAEAALHESEEQYRTLFETMDEGFALCELIRDADGSAVDYRYVDLNRALVRHGGISPDALKGRRATEVFPNLDRWLIETYARVVDEGESVLVEHYFPHVDRWLRINAYPRGGDYFAVLYSDVTARVRAEEALRTSEAKYRALFESMDEAYAVVEVLADDTGVWNDFLFLEVNPAFVMQTGMDYPVGRRATEILGTPNPNWAHLYGQVAETGEPIRVEEREPTLDRIFDLYIFRLGGEGSRQVAVLFTDITERKRIEETLRNSETRFRQFSNASSDVLWIRDAETLAFEMLSPAFNECYGVERERILAGDHLGNWLTLIHPEDRDEALASTERVRAGEQVTHGFRIIRSSDGDIRWLLNTDFPLRNEAGVIERIGGIATDITGIRRIEEALRESEERFRAVADLVPDLLWSNDETGAADWYNRRWLEYTGQTLAEAARDGWLDVIHPDDRETSRATFQEAIDSGVPLLQEHRIRRHDGTYHWFLVRAAPIRDHQGTIVHWFGTATDIHDQRMARDELETRVVDATSELRQLSRQLLQVQEQERRFLANELHDEIGQALTGLNFTLAMAARDATSAHLEQAAAISQDLLEQVRQLSIDLRPSVLDDMGLIPALTALADRMHLRTGVRIEIRHQGVDRRFPQEIETTAYRVVQEALTNIMRHAETDQASVQLLIDSTIAIWVSDAGKGFDPDAVRRAGTSIGLTGMTERVRLVGGTFRIESARGEGTTIIVELPLDLDRSGHDGGRGPR